MEDTITRPTMKWCCTKPDEKKQSNNIETALSADAKPKKYTQVYYEISISSRFVIYTHYAW